MAELRSSEAVSIDTAMASTDFGSVLPQAATFGRPQDCFFELVGLFVRPATQHGCCGAAVVGKEGPTRLPVGRSEYFVKGEASVDRR
jgi:hypothetical protein